MKPEEYDAHDATALAELVARKEVTASELLDAARARTTLVNGRINAVIRRMDDIADARAAAPDLAGPFAGVPFLLKDLHQDYAGVPTSGGSRSLAAHPAAENGAVVDRWLDAGLVVFGKTNSPEFGAKGITEPEAFGATRNPWNTDHTPGGSSGGSAAAVAAGIVPCAAASDGGGSIRIPAACNGLFGLKPGRGLVPSGPGAGEGLHGSSVHGVVSRSVRDTAGMLDVLAGPRPESPYLTAVPATRYADEVGAAPGPLKIGFCLSSAINPSPSAEAVAAVSGTVELLESLGHEVTELSQAPFDDAQLAEDFLAGWFVYCAYEVAHAKRLTGYGDDAFERDTLIMAALGRATSSLAYCEALERKQDHVRRLAEFHSSHDLLLTPTLATPPPRVGEFAQPAALQLVSEAVLRVRGAGLLRHTPIVSQLIQKNLSWVPYTQLANITGRPAMSVPLHWTAAGLPLGVQFVGPLGGEGQLLRLAGQLEEAQPWMDRRPAL